YLVFIVVSNSWPLVLFCTFWSLEVVGDWTLANNQSPSTSKTIKKTAIIRQLSLIYVNSLIMLSPIKPPNLYNTVLFTK
ncbi:hypothetical protein BpHYR1_004244, partial [Brachionus plicatilis]